MKSKGVMKAWALAFTVAGMLAASASLAEERIEPILTDDGLYTQEWFLQSFLDLSEDLETAAAAKPRSSAAERGRRVALAHPR